MFPLKPFLLLILYLMIWGQKFWVTVWSWWSVFLIIFQICIESWVMINLFLSGSTSGHFYTGIDVTFCFALPKCCLASVKIMNPLVSWGLKLMFQSADCRITYYSNRQTFCIHRACSCVTDFSPNSIFQVPYLCSVFDWSVCQELRMSNFLQ